MSAFIVSDKHIAAMIEFARTHDAYSSGYWWKDTKTGEEVKHMFDNEAAQKLVNENYRSVNYRYQDNTQPKKYNPFQSLSPQNLDPVQILKACNCYDYQACETNDYNESEARYIVDQIRHLAINALIGYEEAQWEIS